MGSSIRGIAISHVATKQYIDGLAENGKWYDEHDDDHGNKHNMKQFGSALIQLRHYIEETTILSLAKVMEDLRYDARTMLDKKIKFTTPFTPPALYYKDLMSVYHLANVIKHNRSIIDRTSSPSSRELVDKYGFRDGDPIVSQEIDYISLIYKCYLSLSDIVGRFNGREAAEVPEDFTENLRWFYKLMIPPAIKSASV